MDKIPYKLKTTTQTDEIGRRLGDRAAIKQIADAGFDAYDYSMFVMNNKNAVSALTGDAWQKYVFALREYADSVGIQCRQAHAPFPTYHKNDPEYNGIIPFLIKRSIEIAGILGARAVVVHPISTGDSSELQMNLNMYRGLEETAVRSGIKIALENMFRRDNGTFCPAACGTAPQFIEMLDSLGTENFTACLDIGHCGLMGGTQYAVDMINALGKKRLGALHIQDTDYLEDLHTIPGLGKLNWENICQALGRIDYTGDVTLESDRCFKNIPDSDIANEYKIMYKVASDLAQRIEYYREKSPAPADF